MTPRQKRIIAILVIADIAIILALVMLATHPSGTSTSPLPAPTRWAGPSTLSGLAELTNEAPRPEDLATPSRSARPDADSAEVPSPQGEASVSGAPLQRTCQWKAAQLLARAGLGGTVALLPDGSLCFEIVHPLSPGETPDEAAQLVWAAFDVVLALQEQAVDECSSLTWVEVTILAVRPDAHGEAQSSQADMWISARVSAGDLAAYGAGELSEDGFIERVAYNTTSQLP